MKNLKFNPICFLFVCFLTVFEVNAQELSPNFETYVFGDKVNVRSKPDKDAPVVAQLLGGDKVTVLDTTPQYLVVNGRRDRFYKIQFDKNKTGFLWGGLISYGGLSEKDGFKFVYNFIESVTGSTGESIPTCEFRVLKNGKVIDKSVEKFTGINDFFETALDSIDTDFGQLGNFKYRINLSLGYPACGYANYDWTLLFDGQKLLSLEPTVGIGDAGVFGYGETWIFPNNPNYFPADNLLRFEISSYTTLDSETESDEYKMVRNVKLKEGAKLKRPAFPDVNFTPKKKIVKDKSKPNKTAKTKG